MNYIVKALVPEIQNKRKEWTNTFHKVSKIITDTGMVVSGLKPEGIDRESLITNDIVVLHNAQPIPAFVAGMAKIEGIPTIGYVSSSRIVVGKDYLYVCDKIVEGSENLTKILNYFLKEGRLY